VLGKIIGKGFVARPEMRGLTAALKLGDFEK